MSCNLTKLVEDDDINTDKYMDVEGFNKILHGMSEHGIGEEFTPRTWRCMALVPGYGGYGRELKERYT